MIERGTGGVGSEAAAFPRSHPIDRGSPVVFVAGGLVTSWALAAAGMVWSVHLLAAGFAIGMAIVAYLGARTRISNPHLVWRVNTGLGLAHAMLLALAGVMWHMWALGPAVETYLVAVIGFAAGDVLGRRSYRRPR